LTDKQYNPLDKLNLGKSVAEALLEGPIQGLGNIPQFEGAGIYVIYYKGPFEPYQLMAQRNEQGPTWPIYIGKAVPAGARTGRRLSTEIAGPVLCNRLAEHADSIRAARNLDIDDFNCRYLTVDDIWIPLAETLLIARFRPVWNQELHGFGNHDPGSGRYSGLRPLWDVLHPGRSWADRCASRTESPERLAERVRNFLREHQPPEDVRISFKPEEF
jgi:Eco29kI restriction endonuclease